MSKKKTAEDKANEFMKRTGLGFPKPDETYLKEDKKITYIEMEKVNLTGLRVKAIAHDITLDEIAEIQSRLFF